MMKNEKKSLELKAYFVSAGTSIINNVAQPFLGMVDIIVLGRSSSLISMASAVIGIVAFNIVYWSFNFLRLIAALHCAEAVEKGDEKRQFEALVHMLLATLIGAMVLVMAKKPIWYGMCELIQMKEIVRKNAMIYYNIVIWGIPFVLLGFVMIGWLSGRKKLKIVIGIQVIGNLVNIFLDAICVQRGMSIHHVAFSTLLSQILIFVLLTICILVETKTMRRYIRSQSIWKLRNIFAEFKVNVDIMIRTLCILIINGTVVAVSSRLGTNILVGNIIMMQIECFMSNIYEGLAGTIYFFSRVGKKRNDIELLKEIQRYALVTSMYLSAAFVVLYGLFRIHIIELYTHIEAVKQHIKYYDGWLEIFPIIAGWGLSAYGLYTGLRHTSVIRNTNLLALAMFGVTFCFMVPLWGNHGLWFAFIMFYTGRSVSLLAFEGDLYAVKETKDIETDHEEKD